MIQDTTVPEVDKSKEKQIHSYVNYALNILEENPETLERTLKESGIDIGVPNYVASIITKIEGIDAGNAIVVAITLLDTIDKILVESGQKRTKEERMSLITETIKRMLEVIPDLGNEINKLVDDSGLREQGNTEEQPLNSEEQLVNPEEQQGVL